MERECGILDSHENPLQKSPNFWVSKMCDFIKQKFLI